VWCNALYQLAPSAGGVPVACIVRRLLSSRSLAESRTFLARVPHACGQSYLIGSPEGVAALECSARGCDEVRAGGAAVWHANHPVGADPGSEPPAAGSLARDAFAGRTLPAASSAEGLRAILADTTVPVSKPGGAGGDSYTLWAVVAEPSLPPLVAATAGPPSASPWVSVGLAPAHVQG
jgi:hypothetical protein